MWSEQKGIFDEWWKQAVLGCRTFKLRSINNQGASSVLSFGCVCLGPGEDCAPKQGESWIIKTRIKLQHSHWYVFSQYLLHPAVVVQVYEMTSLFLSILSLLYFVLRLSEKHPLTFTSHCLQSCYLLASSLPWSLWFPVGSVHIVCTLLSLVWVSSNSRCWHTEFSKLGLNTVLSPGRDRVSTLQGPIVLQW